MENKDVFIYLCCCIVKEHPAFPSKNFIFPFYVFTIGSSLVLPAPAHLNTCLAILFSKSIKFLFPPTQPLPLPSGVLFECLLFHSIAVWSPGSALSLCLPASSGWLSGSSSQLQFLAIHLLCKAAGKLWKSLLSLLVVLLRCSLCPCPIAFSV